MDIPLGLTAGNALEVRESVEVLAGGGPSDIVELTVIFAREMLDAAKITPLMDPADALKNGAAMDHWRRMISAQGGDPDGKLPVAKESQEFLAPTSGVVTHMDAMSVGIAAWRLGAGRAVQGEKLQLGAGIEIHAKPGEHIQAGSPLYTLHTDESPRFDRALEALSASFTIGSQTDPIHRLPLIIDRIEG